MRFFVRLGFGKRELFRSLGGMMRSAVPTLIQFGRIKKCGGRETEIEFTMLVKSF